MLKGERIIVRFLHDLRELNGCVELQQRIWDFADIDVVPEPVFVVAIKTGGQVLGAFAGGMLIGFALSFAAQGDPRAYLHSHMVAVLPEYQNQGVGRQLKLAQRENALARGIDLIEWTFDPFQIKNAYFNIALLGALVRRYIPNCYGHTSSPLHRGLPTDRLIAEWWLRSERVESCVMGKYQNGSFTGERIAVPVDIQETGRRAPQEAEQIHLHLRKSFESSFAKGLAAVGFQRSGSGGTYLMGAYED